MYTVYVLKSLKDKRTYVGCTKDLENRIKEHNAGEVKSTKTRIPFILWYKEDFINKYEAFKREQHFKTSWGRRQLRKILDNVEFQKGINKPSYVPKVIEVNRNVQ